ncbi:hypothetical protein EI94DRAFT_883965 [Lactarius quietus]|nr:hypothetical protein EI94DRAFT_883965 [Lactarius quietus]
MLFNKSIVSLVAAIALATSLAAARKIPSGPNPPKDPVITLVVRGPQVKARDVVPNCSTGALTCCGSTVKFGALTLQQQTELHSLDSDVNENLNVGLNCAAADEQGCSGPSGNHQSLCCDAIQNTADHQSVAANCVSP